MNYIDFHTHLDMENFEGERDSILDQCFKENGFKAVVLVADPYVNKSTYVIRELCESHKNVFAMIAAHPHEAKNYSYKIENNIEQFLEYEKTIGVGEAGLDYHYNFSSREDQIEVFKKQVKIASEYKKPLVIHSREAESDVLSILEELKFSEDVIFHCYTGSLNSAKLIIDKGYYISISGIVTFKKAHELKEIVKFVPLDRIFTETDAPYLSPVPFRGKTNSPVFVKYIAEEIARLKNISVKFLNQNIFENFNRIFSILK